MQANSPVPVGASGRSVIGILGGTFDPIHVGHIALARAALRELNLAQVRFVPAAQPWQKTGVTDAAHRAQMVQLAIAGEPRCVLDRHEIEHGGASYTVDSLRAARVSLGDAVPIVLIIGSDQMRTLDTWHQWQSLPTLAHLAVALRGQAVLALSCALQAFYNERWAPASDLLRASAGSVVELPMAPVDVSATEVRALLARSALESAAGSTPGSTPGAATRTARLACCLAPQVLDYIRARHLYA